MIISDLNYLEAAHEVKVAGGRRKPVANKFELTVKYATINHYAASTAIALFGGKASASSSQQAVIRL